MAYQIVFSDQAKLDILKAYEWYEQQQTGLGDRFFSDVEEASGLIRQSPLVYPNKYKKTREKVLNKFPFIMIYLIENNSVFVQSVFAAKQHPKKKYRKRK